MMAVLEDQATSRRAVQAFFVLVLLTISCYALASNSPISSNVKSRMSSPDVKEHDRTERKLAAVPAPEPAVSGNAPASSPSNPRPPSPPPNSRPALISPSDDTPGTDLAPRILSSPPASQAPITSPIRAWKKLTVAFIITGTILCIACLVGLSCLATVCFCPDLLPCCRGRFAPIPI